MESLKSIRYRLYFLIFLSLMLLSSLSLSVAAQQASASEIADSFGRAGGIIFAVLGQPYFMVVLIMVLTFGLIYQIIMLALSRFDQFKDDGARTRNIAYVISGIVTLSFFFGGSYSDGSISPMNAHSRVESILSQGGSIPLIFSLLTAALFFVSSWKNNPDMPAGKRIGGIMAFFGLALIIAHGMVGSMWIVSGILFAIVGSFLYLFSHKFNFTDSHGGSGFGSTGLGAQGNSSKNHPIRDAVKERVADWMRPKNKQEKDAENAAKKEKKKKNSLHKIKALHDSSYFKRKMLEFSNYIKEEKEDLKKEYDIVSDLANNASDMIQKVNSLDSRSDNPAIKDLTESIKSTIDSMTKAEGNEDDLKKDEKKKFRKAYRRDIRKINKALEDDHKKMSDHLEKFKKNWDSSELEGFNEFVARVETLIKIIESEQRNISNIISVVTSIENNQSHLAELKDESEEIKKACDSILDSLNHHETVLQALSKQQDQTKREEARRQAENKKIEDIDGKKNSILKSLNNLNQEIQKDYGTFSTISKNLKTLDDLIVMMQRSLNEHTNTFESTDNMYENIRGKVDDLDKNYEAVSGLIHKVYESLSELEKDYGNARKLIFDHSAYSEFNKSCDDILSKDTSSMEGMSELNDFIDQNVNNPALSDFVQKAKSSVDDIQSKLSLLQDNAGVIKNIYYFIHKDNHMEALQNLNERDDLPENQKASEMLRLIEEIETRISSTLGYLKDEELKSEIEKFISQRKSEYSNRTTNTDTSTGVA